MTDMRRGGLLRLYLALSWGFALLAPAILRRRRDRGKEDPARMGEKLARNLPAPQGQPLVWLHAVGLGEVLSLRGLVTRMAALRPDLHFMITSTTRASAQVLAKNMPPRTQHVFLPVDAPQFRRRFLDRMQPALCLWAEQDIWPGFVSDLARRGVPQAMVATRMNAVSFQKHRKAASLYRDLYGAMALVTAQDAATARHLEALGAPAPVPVSGPVKPAAPPLAHDPATLAMLRDKLEGRRVWAVAPSHPEDEKIALAAQDLLRRTDPSALLVIVPRDPARAPQIVARCAAPPPLWSQGAVPTARDAVWICDTFGDLGLVYRLADTVLTGGSFGAIEGHNPWEAAMLDCTIAHGPRTGNFAQDYARLTEADAAYKVTDAQSLVAALQAPPRAAAAAALVAAAAAQTDALAGRLLELLDGT